MEGIGEKQTPKCQLLKEQKQYEAGTLALEEGRKIHGAILTLLSADASHREELAAFFYDLLLQWRENGYILGMEHGYATADGLVKLRKRKSEHKAIAKIARVLTENPLATNREVCCALDDSGTELYKSKTMPKGALFWSQVVKIQYYKNLISRARKQVAMASKIRELQEKLSEINAGWGVRSADFLSQDSLIRKQTK
jgi:hypothetical protein